MIWDETTSPAVIVMLTRFVESGCEKCYPYFPRLFPSVLRINADDEFGDGFIHKLTVASTEDYEEGRVKVSELDMTSDDGSETKKIWHLFFGGWPDFQVPEGAECVVLLKLIQISRNMNANDSTNPRIVQSSSGVGRSGTFIALDWLLQELEEGSLDDIGETEDPIFTVVETIRH